MSTPSSKRYLTIADVIDGFTTRPESNLLWNQEFLTSHGPDNCHPVCLGDTFKEGRYKVVRKLGWGSSSTVWLAQDITWSHDSKREVAALKALHANKTTSQLFPALYDDFNHNRPNGCHHCIVMQVLGPSIRIVIESFGGDRIDPEDLLRLARQVLEATATLHEAGFAHGDLDANNIVFSISNLAEVSNEALIAALDELETAELIRLDVLPLDNEHLPKQLSSTALWDDWIDEDEEDIRLIDVGDLFRAGDQIPSSGTERDAINPPATLFEDTFDYRVDLWRAGCVVSLLYSLVFASCPFMAMGEDASLVEQMIELVGALPSAREPRRQAIREASSRPIMTRGDDSTTHLEKKFKDRVPEPELAPILAVIQGLMRFRPQDRISARDALALLTQ